MKKTLAPNLTSESTRRRAIVIGGGISGLISARVLASHMDEVLLLERDAYPSGPRIRPGVPQARHVHLLLARGNRILEAFFPGLSKELTARGALKVQMGEDLKILSYYGWRIQYPGGMELLTFTRPLLEYCLYQRLARQRPVQILEGYRVNGLIANDEGNRVLGVRYVSSDDEDSDQELYGDLIVDASGRFSRTPEWLSAIGYNRPRETIIDPRLGYASRLYAIPEPIYTAEKPEWKALVIQGKPPDQTRGGVLLPVEGNRWHVTLAGINGDYPATDDSGFIQFARTLRSPLLYKSIKNAEPLSRISGARNTSNRRRHYEELTAWPERFVVTGDSVCVFNPVFAQGMSTAALQAMSLDQCLREYCQAGKVLDGMARHFQHHLTRVIRTPWLMATTDDLRWPGTEGGHYNLWIKGIQKYLDSVFALATENPEIDYVLAEVAHLIKPAQTLLQKHILIPALVRLLNPLEKER